MSLLKPAALVLFLAAFLASRPAHGLTIEIVKNGTKVQQYQDSNAAFNSRVYNVPASTVLVGQLVYANPHNACVPVEPVSLNMTNQFALIEEFLDCPFFAENNLNDANFSAMVAFSAVRGMTLRDSTNLPQMLITDNKFKQYLIDNAVVGLSPNATDVLLKIYDNSWKTLEKLFIIFGCVLLAAVVLSIGVFCGSICCRVLVTKWRTRGLSRWRVRQLPRRRYRRERETCETCSICLEDFKEGEHIRVLPCEHFYHPKCVDEWLQKWNRTCPLCKTAIRRRGAENGPPLSSEAETSHLLQSTSPDDHQDSSAGTYGATGYTANPLNSSLEEEESSSFEGSGGARVSTRPQNIRSTSSNVVATIELVSSAANSRRSVASSLASFHTPMQSEGEGEGEGEGRDGAENEELFVTGESGGVDAARS